MSRKRHTRELIEILLRQQRENRPTGSDPLEGIEWEGLPPELQDRVYRPQERKEPLVEFLTSPLVGGDRDQVCLKAEGTDAEIPPRPSVAQRARTWFFDLFALLNRIYEVRLATILAFLAAAVVVAALAYLLGTARGKSSLPLYEHAGPPELLTHTAPVTRTVPAVRSVRGPGIVATVRKEDSVAARGRLEGRQPGGAGGAVAKPAGLYYSIAVATVPSENAARSVCAKLEAAGLAALRPRYYRVRNGWFVLLGQWSGSKEAKRRLEELKGTVFRTLQNEGVISRLDQYVFKNTSRR